VKETHTFEAFSPSLNVFRHRYATRSLGVFTYCSSESNDRDSPGFLEYSLLASQQDALFRGPKVFQDGKKTAPSAGLARRRPGTRCLPDSFERRATARHELAMAVSLLSASFSVDLVARALSVRTASACVRASTC
jgi:hypothetical protein